MMKQLIKYVDLATELLRENKNLKSKVSDLEILYECAMNELESQDAYIKELESECDMLVTRVAYERNKNK